MSSSSTETTNKNILLDNLQKAGNYLLSATIICYIVGFIITNIYLGSLGVVNLDLLKSRYVLTGILFIIFLAAITYQIYGLIHLLRENTNQSPIKTIAKVVIYSLRNIAVLLVSSPALTVFSAF
jgi:hypothetical protein